MTRDLELDLYRAAEMKEVRVYLLALQYLGDHYVGSTLYLLPLIPQLLPSSSLRNQVPYSYRLIAQPQHHAIKRKPLRAYISVPRTVLRTLLGQFSTVGTGRSSLAPQLLAHTYYICDTVGKKEQGKGGKHGTEYLPGNGSPKGQGKPLSDSSLAIPVPQAEPYIHGDSISISARFV